MGCMNPVHIPVPKPMHRAGERFRLWAITQPHTNKMKDADTEF